jgi:hypothetical protein
MTRGVMFEFETEVSKPNELGIEFKFSSEEEGEWRKSVVNSVFETFLSGVKIDEENKLPNFIETPSEDEQDVQVASEAELKAFEAEFLQKRWANREFRHRQWEKETGCSKVFNPEGPVPRGIGKYFMSDGITPVPT